MRSLRLFCVMAMLGTGPALGQSNTTAGLAGVGAGVALGGASGQNGTTPSSATGGGGNTPIEIQIMAFQAMQKIAKEIAIVTASLQIGCKRIFETNPTEKTIAADRTTLQKDLKTLKTW